MRRVLLVSALVASAPSACSFSAPGAAPPGGDAGDAGDAPDARDVTDAGDPDAQVIFDAPPGTPCTLWCRSRVVTIKQAVTSTNQPQHVRFPVLVVTAADSKLSSGAAADGHDIRFLETDAQGVTTVMHYERVSYAAGSLVAWLQVGALSNASQITMQYGNAAAPDQADPNGTWTASWLGVFHLDEATGDVVTDRSMGGTPGVFSHTDLGAGVADTRVAGKIGGAIDLQTQTGKITMSQSARLDALGSGGTIEFWLKPNPPPADQGQTYLVTSHRFDASATGLELAKQATNVSGSLLYFYPTAEADHAGSDNYAGVASPITNNQWQHIAITWSFASRRAQLWRNGVLLSPLDHALSPTWDRAGVPGSWTWGNDPDRLLRHFTGTLDELRLESNERSPEWIATTYANQSAPDAFLKLGGEVVQP